MASYHLSVKVGGKGKALAHAQYIAREREYKVKHQEKLEAVEHGNLPNWAQGNPNLFWQCADEFERKNGATYREIEIALPRELTPKQRQDLVQVFVEQELGDQHAYTWAIHNPKASIEGGEQPHAHIMFSERIQDGIDRGADQFFKRYNSKYPERGGCQKSNTTKSAEQRKTELVELRERFADLQNAFLEEYGHADRVDHRSLVDQGIDRSPEKHLGWMDSQKQASKDLLLEYREANQALDQHLGYLPQHLAKLDREQQQALLDLLHNDEKILESNHIVNEYNALFQKYRNQYADQSVFGILENYKKQAYEIRKKVEKLAWYRDDSIDDVQREKMRQELMAKHDELCKLHENLSMKREAALLCDHDFGREVVIEHIAKNHPDLNENFNKAQAFLKAVAQLREYQQRQELEKVKENQKDQDNDQGYEMSM
ncbi:hypothetical protein A7P53_16005 [Acinetobacter defluvii]|uniref:MobA/MobL family protein n=1 Tax=Acinetobacter defluvii TaxID=1871111 RepID=UPI00148FB12A|nr:MobA/MobL family protein [Acinetobacter defluvii]NNP74158.1 hypothetical protein [Acinetobacter defluvii]